MKKRRLGELFKNNLASLILFGVIISAGVVLAGNITFKEGDMEVGGNLSVSGTIEGDIKSYDTGWLHIYNNDWTSVHLGSDNSTSVSNVTHNLNAPLNDLLVSVFISTDGTDANSFGVGQNTQHTSGVNTYGLTVFQVDSNNITVQTGYGGVCYAKDSDGDLDIIDNEAWFYKIKVYKLG